MSQLGYKPRSTAKSMDRLVGNLVVIMVVFFAVIGIIEFTRKEEEI